MIISLILLWVVFIIFANLRSRVLPKVEGTVGEVPIYWVFVIFTIINVIVNLFTVSPIFMQIPTNKGMWTVTGRLKHNLQTQSPDSWRWKLSDFACRRIIEPWDQGHCALS